MNQQPALRRPINGRKRPTGHTTCRVCLERGHIEPAGELDGQPYGLDRAVSAYRCNCCGAEWVQ